MPTRKTDRPNPHVLWRLAGGGIGAGLGAATAAALLAGLRAFGVSVTHDLSMAYYVIGAAAGFLFGLTRPPQSNGGEGAEFRQEAGSILGIGVLLCGLACLFVAWGWPSYRILPVCTAVAEGKASSSATRTTHQGGKVVSSETSVNFTYTVDGVVYRGSGETTRVRYDPARPDVYFSDTGLEARHARIVEAPWVFAGGLSSLLIGVLLAVRNRGGWAGMWAASLTIACLAAIATSAVIVCEDGAVSQRLSGNLGRAKRDPADQPLKAVPSDHERPGK